MNENLEIIFEQKYNVRLKKISVNKFKCCCPFHIEKTPSFFIDIEKNVYKCFGCDKKGNLYFLLFDKNKTEKKNGNKNFYKPTIRNKDNLNSSVSYTKNSYIDFIYNLINENKKDILFSPIALNYLIEKRMLDMEIIELFDLGFVKSKNLINSFFQLIESSFKLNYFQYIFIPIFSLRQNKYIGFSLCCIDKKKYLHCPSNMVFEKNSNIFCHKNIKNIKRNKDILFIVEGFFDLFSIYKYSQYNAIATLGVNFSKEQTEDIILLSRDYNKLVILFDNDKAGIISSLKLYLELVTKTKKKILFFDWNNQKKSKDIDEIFKKDKNFKLCNDKFCSVNQFVDFIINIYSLSLNDREISDILTLFKSLNLNIDNIFNIFILLKKRKIYNINFLEYMNSLTIYSQNNYISESLEKNILLQFRDNNLSILNKYIDIIKNPKVRDMISNSKKKNIFKLDIYEYLIYLFLQKIKITNMISENNYKLSKKVIILREKIRLENIIKKLFNNIGLSDKFLKEEFYIEI